jgi:hypothetical protein
MVVINAVLRIAVAVVVCLAPVVLVTRELADPGLSSPGMPQSAWRLHRALTPKIERWARQRLESTRAAELPTTDISGTEWPLFGSVFYLWATESLQAEYETNPPPAAVAPKEYARGAVDAATRLVIDPSQAGWVKRHWGTNYLHTENAFYRMLVIAALTSHARLTDDRQYLPMLKDQADSLAAELDASAHGLLEDYPGECYPGDVLTAIAMIRRADGVLGTNRSAFVQRALRGFQNQRLDSRGLVPYAANRITGTPVTTSRGCGNSYVSLFAPEIWPEQAREWYVLYTRHFWQEVWTAAGFREFPKGLSGFDWHFDVDAGPVLKGYGFAACAFGVGAARVNGHFEHAYPLATEMFATSCPLPNGTWLVPRLLSNAADAPYLGEAGILFNLTRLPAQGVAVKTGGSVPRFTLIVLTLQALVGLWLVGSSLRTIRRWLKQAEPPAVPLVQWQFHLWVCLCVVGTVSCLVFGQLVGLAALLLAQLLPRGIRREERPR